MLGRPLRRLKIAASALLLLVIPVLPANAVAADNPAEDSATAQFLQAPSIASVAVSDGNRTPSEPVLLAQQKKPPSPFEEIPEEETPQRKPPSPFEDVEEAEEAAPARRAPLLDIVESIQFRGTRRIPRDSLLARIFTKAGDVYDEANLRRDFMVLWNSGYFDDLRPGSGRRRPAGKSFASFIVERRVVRTIRYEGNKSATVSDILQRFKERKVGLSVESRYDPTKVQRAVIVLRELLGERGRQYAKVTPDVRQISPLVDRDRLQHRRRSQGQGRQAQVRRPSGDVG